jgi:hypothetical protein
MALNPFLWFLITLLVSMSNVIVSTIIYYYLQMHKRLSRNLATVRDITFFYSVGMMFVIIFSIIAFILFVPL